MDSFFGAFLDFLGLMGYLIFGMISYVTLVASWDNMSGLKLFPLITIRYTVLSIILVYIGTLAPSKIHLSHSSIVIFVENPTTSTLAVSRFYQCLFIGCLHTLMRIHFLDIYYHTRHVAIRDSLRSIIDLRYNFKNNFWLEVFGGILTTLICLFSLNGQVPINQIDEIRESYGIELNQTAHLSFTLFNCSTPAFFPLLSSSCSINWTSLLFLIIVAFFLGKYLCDIRIFSEEYVKYYDRNVINYPIIHQHLLAQWKTTMRYQVKYAMVMIHFPMIYIYICLFFNIHQNRPITFLIYIFTFYPAIYNLIGLATLVHNKTYIFHQCCAFRSEMKCCFYSISDLFFPPPEIPETGVFREGNIEYLYDSD